MSFRLERYSPSLLRIIFGDSDSLVLQEIIDLIPFHVFDIINVVSEIIIIITFFTLL